MPLEWNPKKQKYTFKHPFWTPWRIKFETGRVALWMGFPIALYWWFNSRLVHQFFDDYYEIKNQTYDPHGDDMKGFIKEHRIIQLAKQREEWEKHHQEATELRKQMESVQAKKLFNEN